MSNLMAAALATFIQQYPRTAETVWWLVMHSQTFALRLIIADVITIAVVAARIAVQRMR